MNSWTIFGCLFISVSVSFLFTQAVPIKPEILELETNGNSVLSIRTKRNPIPVYPHRTMMLAGFYRPVRHSVGSQAGGVFAQGNAVSGGAYLRANQPNYLARGPEPVDESDVSSAEAEAAPEQQEEPAVDDEDQSNPPSGYEEESEPHQWQEHTNPHTRQPSQEEEESPSHPSESPVGEEPDVPQTSVAKRPSKTPGSKKTKKTSVYVDNDNQQQSDEDDEEDETDEEPNVPFVPFKANRKNNMPNLNNFFPMVFSFPKSYSRDGSSGSPPGMITAIANSFSTGKGGVASSVATAYGGSPNGKKKRNQSSHDD
ncbi:uncharacterized protein [Chelonus insularis]|uniref:uncharacterized protein n=1 Tax=Chelonus insularis TaxID=460826 RepID=UPI00158F0CD9|nr:uncharacterized protein LOC118067324 [Chelonus insularis]